MKFTHLKGLDVLRGLGIFILIVMHTAFYHYRDLTSLDLNNPPLVVTIIGLLLMFAGIFAIVSGFSHALQNNHKQLVLAYSNRHILRYNLISGLLVLVVAYLYFLFTGPGLVNMATKSMNNSLFVELINTGVFKLPDLERILYVDSLVMIGMNVCLLAAIYLLIKIRFKERQAFATLLIALIFFAISLIRIPLYTVYIDALDKGNFTVVLLLNWFVNKNNPIFPFLAFGLIGQALALILLDKNWKTLKRIVLFEGTILFVMGILLYIFLPDTMLERSIDLIWYAIMLAQFGLFQLIVIAFIAFFDRKDRKLGPIARTFSRFSRGGLTIFFVESMVSALIHRILVWIIPNFYFGLWPSLAYGLCLALAWSYVLVLWEKKAYRYGIEYWMARILSRFGHSRKADKLKERLT